LILSRSFTGQSLIKQKERPLPGAFFAHTTGKPGETTRQTAPWLSAVRYTSGSLQGMRKSRLENSKFQPWELVDPALPL